jgi:hypothetical protein
MEYDIPPDSARAHFFNEDGEMLPPFRLSGWRGGALDRDRYDNTRMPQTLLEAIIEASGSEQLLIERYAPDHLGPDRVDASWSAFFAYAHTPEHWSLEFVVFDASARWAVLADADVTVIGAESALADSIDALLQRHGMGLVELTDDEFPGLDPATQPGARYLLAVSGRSTAP